MPHWPHTPRGWAPEARPENADERVATFSRLAAGPFSIGLRAYRSDFQQAPHAHDRAIIDFNLCGAGVGRYAGDERESRAGEVEPFAPGVAHSFRAGPRGIRTLHVSVARDDLEGDGARVDFERRGPDAAAALRAALALLDAARRPEDADPSHAETLAWGLFGTVFRARGSDDTNTRGVRRVIDLLHATTDRPLGLGELAREAGVHRGTLARRFLAATGTTPGAMHRRLRLAHAASLLARGETPAGAARAAGFADQPHLTRWLHRECAVTPDGFKAALGLKSRP